MNDQVTEYDAAAALAAVQEARSALLQRVEWGSWRYDLIYSALAAGVVMGQALPLPFNLVADLVIVTALIVLARWWRARTGVWISGVTPKRARWAALAIGLFAGVAAIAAAIFARQGQPWTALVLGPVVGVLALGGSRLWRRIFRAEVEAGGVAETTGRRNWLWPLMGVGLVSGLISGVLAERGVDPYVVGLFFGVALALVASPGVFALKRRILSR